MSSFIHPILFSFQLPLFQTTIISIYVSELQIRGGIDDDSKTFFLISQQKHRL